MPSKQKRLCNELGCKNIATRGSKCDIHYQEPVRDYKQEKAAKPRHDSWYSDPRWRRIRAVHLKREPLCADCMARGTLTPASIVDHIIPHLGNWQTFTDHNNLQSLCKRCHDQKTAREDGGFGNRRGGSKTF